MQIRMFNENCFIYDKNPVLFISNFNLNSLLIAKNLSSLHNMIVVGVCLLSTRKRCRLLSLAQVQPFIVCLVGSWITTIKEKGENNRVWVVLFATLLFLFLLIWIFRLSTGRRVDIIVKTLRLGIKSGFTSLPILLARKQIKIVIMTFFVVLFCTEMSYHENLNVIFPFFCLNELSDF